jgi:hypothetical protein
MNAFELIVLVSLALPPDADAGGDDDDNPGQEPAGVQRVGWQANPQTIADLQNRKVAWIYREGDVPAYVLPDVLQGRGGSRVTSAADWERTGRPDTLELFRKFVYGRSPARPREVRFDVVATDPRAMDGRATLTRVGINSVDGDKSFRFEAAILVPNGSPRRVPAFLLINNRAEASADPSRLKKDGFWPAEEILARGYAAAVFRTVDVDPDTADDAARARGVRGVWPAGGGTPGEDAWATIAAWSWGASRVMDYLGKAPTIDPARVALVGHSRGGKTSLWAGAQDERFALTVSNDSGCGGAALGRRKFGETVEAINRGFPHWFCRNFKAFNDREGELPVDQHQLLAMIAPRGLYVASADDDLWADPRGEFLSLAHASPAYALYGHEGPRPDQMPPLDTPVIRDRVAYHVRRGGHGLTPYDWQRFMDFADRLWGDHRDR